MCLLPIKGTVLVKLLLRTDQFHRLLKFIFLPRSSRRSQRTTEILRKLIIYNIYLNNDLNVKLKEFLFTKHSIYSITNRSMTWIPSLL